MKKIISLTLAIILLSVLAMPLAAMAQEPIKSCTPKKAYTSGSVTCPKTEIKEGESNFGICCLLNTIDNVTGWLFYLMSAVAVLLFIVGGVFYMTAGGDPDKAKKGKTIIIYAIIGLAIALVAKMIPSLVTTVIG